MAWSHVLPSQKYIGSEDSNATALRQRQSLSLMYSSALIQIHTISNLNLQPVGLFALVTNDQW